MHVARVVAIAAQAYRPAAVETRRAPVAAPQGILSLADLLAVARDGRRKDLKQCLYDRILTAGKILGGLGSPAQ